MGSFICHKCGEQMNTVGHAALDHLAINSGGWVTSHFCKMTKHDLVKFNTDVYYQKCGYLYQSNVYILFN